MKLISHMAARTKIRTEQLVGTKRDCYQRVYGLAIRQFECDMELAPAVGTFCTTYGLAPGHYYAVHVYNTRGGSKWGADSRVRYFESPPERDAHITQRIKNFWKSQQIGGKKNAT